MQTTLSAMDTVLEDADAAYTVYTTDYAAYLKIFAEHSGGLVRFNGNSVTAVYSQDALDMTVNSTPRQTKEWYHSYERPYQNPPADPHTIDPRYAKTHWTLNDLPKDYFCDGPCSVKFRSAEEAFSEHRTECGTGDDIGFVLDDVKKVKLRARQVGEGCGHKYYKCPGHLGRKGVQKHEIRTCTQTILYAGGRTGACLDSDGKPLQYRRCMYWIRDHDESRTWNLETLHSDSDEEANAGGTTPTTTPTESSLVVCTISGCQDSTPYDPTSSSGGWHAPCNECSQYRCTGGGHSWYPSCSDTTHTNSNGDSCTAGGYECVSHTPVYPAPAAPAAPAPPTTVTCGQCSVSYNPQGSLASRHELIPCPRTRTAHNKVCGGSFYRCSNTNTCIWGWRHSSWNDDPNP